MKNSKPTLAEKMRRFAKAPISRRQFMQSAGAATAFVTAGFAPGAFAEEGAPRVSEDDPMAKALNYVHDAGSVDAAKRFSNQFCNNCALYGGGAEDEWAGCSIFPGKNVAGRGWCSAWAARQPIK